jgi:HSP20 family protein
VDIFETAESVVVRAEIPGVSGENLRVNVDGEILRINGIRTIPTDSEVRRLHQMEIAFGAFEREVRISVPFQSDRVAAHLEDGFLLVTLPKQVPVRRQVAVETE